MCGLPRAGIVERCSVSDRNNPEYLPSECLLHLVREARSDNSDDHFAALYRQLRRRVLARLPRPEVGRSADGKELVSRINLDISDAVMGRFQELLMLDRQSYEERLDYFEINFDDAVAALRSTAKRKARRDEGRSAPMTYDDETSELNAEIEEAATAQNPISESKLDDPAYRSRLDLAIDTLPEPLRLVMELLLKGYPIESQEPPVRSVAGSLGCTEKTVRNRRAKAIQVLRKALNEEET
jgi:RNA polymerase sigma factor (sigma-70 family)